MGRWLAAMAALVATWGAAPPPARAVDFDVTRCEASASGIEVRIRARVVNHDGDLSNGTLKVFLNGPTSPPGPGSGDDPDVSLPFTGAGLPPDTYAEIDTIGTWLQPLQLTNGVYQLWCRVDHPSDTVNTDNNVEGPLEYVIGPDLWPLAFWVDIEGDTTVYNAVICNTGTDVAYNFRVGFYFNRTPTEATFADAFKAYEALAPAFSSPWFGGSGFDPSKCLAVELKRTPTPNGVYRSWVKADDGNFEEEVREDNNVAGPLAFQMSNADLVVERFRASVSDAEPWEVTYQVTVCNRGTGPAGAFWIDLYHDRATDDPPQLGQPGDQNIGVTGLPSQACADRTFRWKDPETLLPTGPQKAYYESWVQADADEFVFDPDRSTNLEGGLKITVPGGAVTGGCTDLDGDGYGVGSSCLTPQDCNDNDPSIHPGAVERCDDGVDQNCNETPDDGCPGIHCEDHDGDGWPSGPDCVLPDCDDTDPTRYPRAEEVCGDGIDGDCDGIVDDCCEGVGCCDLDGDGYGVGEQCPGGEQDCNDTNPAAGSAEGAEICGDNQDNDCDGLIDENCPGSYCTDADDDGFGVGVGCNGPQDPDDGDPTVPAGGEVCGDGLDNDGNGIPDDGCNTCVDTDLDGWYVGHGDDPNCRDRPRDCDDTDADVHPGAVEVCDLVDNDCDYTVDEGTPDDACPDPDCVTACAADPSCEAACPLLDCIDGDGDGWGVGTGCVVEDCDDEDATRYPGAPEVCGDHIDQDCDDTPDDGCPGVDCVDGDGDGWGVGPDCVTEDPDDDDPTVWPGAPEICGDGIDQSGDGIPDDGCLLCVDHDGDGYGVGSFCAVRDCNDDDPSVHPGAAESCRTGDRNCDGRPVISSRCAQGCACSHEGGAPFEQWPEATLLTLFLAGGGIRQRRRRTGGRLRVEAQGDGDAVP